MQMAVRILRICRVVGQRPAEPCPLADGNRADGAAVRLDELLVDLRERLRVRVADEEDPVPCGARPLGAGLAVGGAHEILRDVLIHYQVRALTTYLGIY